MKHRKVIMRKDDSYEPVISKLHPTITGDTIIDNTIGNDKTPEIVPKCFHPNNSPLNA